MTRAPSATGPVQVRAEVVASRRVGDYHTIVLAAPGVAERVQPGHFAALAVGDDPTAMLLRRCFSIYRVDTAGSLGGTIELVIDAHGPGTRWLVSRPRGATADVVAPLGRPFSLPTEPVPTILVGGGYGAAPLFMLADSLRARGSRVDLVLGAATEARLFGVVEGRRQANSLSITTDDGTLGTRGRVTDAVAPLISEHGSQVIYACGPMPMLAALGQLAEEHGIVAQCAVEEAMACGVGVCMTCVLPVVGSDGQTRMVRSCADGPVFFADMVRWEEVGTVPTDCVGSPEWTAEHGIEPAEHRGRQR